MFKTTSAFTQTRKITMALTMSFAAATLFTACGSDDSSDTTQNQETEMSSENQSNMDTTENITPMPSETAAQADEPKSEAAETHFVTAEGLKFNPLVVKINSGDSVSWRNMSTHNSESIDGLIPEGAEKWNSPMSANYKHTFTEEGIYIYKCTPHIGSGMGGVIIVGNPVNLEQIKNADVSGGAGRLVRKAISEAESM